MRLPVASAMWMANSATSVFPAPVGADTMTDCPASIARIASSWKSSRENGYRARNCSSSSITRHSTTGGRLDPRWPRRSSRPLFSLLEARAGLYSAGRAMIVFHVAITAAEDYLTRREGTVVEGPMIDHDMAQLALIEMRGAGRVAFGGFFEGGQTLVLVKTPDAAEALGWFTESGFWKSGELAARPLLHVL